MKQPVKIGQIIGPATTATIVINKNGMSVEDKSESISDSGIIQSYLKQLVDMDNWQHSWHMDIGKAQFKSTEERKKVREILKEKISQREREIEMLKNGVHILGRWNINTK